MNVVINRAREDYISGRISRREFVEIVNTVCEEKENA